MFSSKPCTFSLSNFSGIKIRSTQQVLEQTFLQISNGISKLKKLNLLSVEIGFGIGIGKGEGIAHLSKALAEIEVLGELSIVIRAENDITP